jgi:alpha-L-fucosidase
MDHPWEESRGMGFSYGFNRAERIEHYHTGRELIILLVDLVSRGGNLLLDIGPAADGTIPVIMEERLNQMGSWLKVNGEAIYGTKSWNKTRQWSSGEEPKVDYKAEFNSTYDVAKLVEEPAAGKASIDAFFTAKGNDIYVILPRWPGRKFTVQNVEGSPVKAITLLGGSAALKFKSQGATVAIDLPEMPTALMSQPAWVLKLSR